MAGDLIFVIVCQKERQMHLKYFCEWFCAGEV